MPNSLKMQKARAVSGWSSAVNACEEHGTYKESWMENEYRATVTLRCAWNERFDLIADIRDNFVPCYWANDAFFQSATIAPFYEKVESTGEMQVLDWLTALVTITYSTLAAEEYYTESFEPNVQFRSLPYQNFVWISSSGRVQLKNDKESPGFQIRGSTYSVRVTNVKFENFDSNKYATYVGCVNESVVSLPHVGLDGVGHSFEPEQLLLLPAPVTCRRIPTSTGDKVFRWDYTAKYGIQEHIGGWNSWYRLETENYERMAKNTPADAPAYEAYKKNNIQIYLPDELHN